MSIYVKDWYVISNTENGKRYARAWRIHQSTNLLAEIKQFQDADTMLQMKTFKEAKATAQHWNESYKANGTYLFDNAPAF